MENLSAREQSSCTQADFLLQVAKNIYSETFTKFQVEKKTHNSKNKMELTNSYALCLQPLWGSGN
jgi:hypothetical protein